MKIYPNKLRSSIAAASIAFVIFTSGSVIAGQEKNSSPVPAGKPQTHCPIMGGPINKNLFYDHDGKRIYYCCYGCINWIKKDPAKYIKQLEDQGVVLDKTPK